MKNENGIAHLLVLMLVVSALVVGGGVGYVTKQNRSDAARQAAAVKQNDDSNHKELDKDDISTLKSEVAEPVKVEEAPVAESKPVSKPAAKTTAATAKTAPKPPEGTISISDDGCTVTVNGKAGMSVKIGAYSDKKGGESDFVLPDSGSLIEKSGGIKGMTAYGKIYNSSGEKVAYASKTITAENCF